MATTASYPVDTRWACEFRTIASPEDVRTLAVKAQAIDEFAVKALVDLSGFLGSHSLIRVKIEATRSAADPVRELVETWVEAHLGEIIDDTSEL